MKNKMTDMRMANRGAWLTARSYRRNSGGWIGFLFSLFSILIYSSAIAQAHFTASAPKSVSENQNFNLTYTLENANGNSLKLPSLNDFTLLGGPSTSMSSQRINNNTVSQSSSYTYVLRPTKQGTFRIAPATIQVNGNTLESNELTIQVTAPSANPQAQQGNQGSQQNQQAQNDADLAKQLKDEVFLKVILSKSSVYKGEMLSATYKLYFRENLTPPNLSKAPSLEGFWSKEIDLDPNVKPTIETINGKQFYTADIMKYNLYPQRSGTLQISPAEISTSAQVTVRSNERNSFNDFFNNPFGQTKNVPLTLKTDAVNVTVKDLPEEGKPKEFAGAVGKFNFETSLSSKESKTDDPVTYTVKISGNGNLSLIEAPTVHLPNGFEVYDPKVKENISNGAAGQSGSKQYDYLIIPRLPGDYKIDGQTFSWFDPSSGKYMTISTPEYSLKITGEPSKNYNTNSSNYVTQQNVSLLGEDIRYIKTSVPSFDKNKKPFFGSLGFISLYAFPFLAFIGLIAARRRNEQLAADIVGTRRRKALKLAKKRLRVAEKFLSHSEKKNFYDEVSRAIWGYLSHKLNIDMAELSKDMVAEKLFARNVKQETIRKLQNLINTCEVSLYAPSAGDAEMKNDYSAALNLIADLEDEIRTKTGERSFVHASLFVIALLVGSSLGAFSQSPAETYSHANELYQSKQFREAADDYEKLISQGYRSEEVYYNLGNCYFKLDSVGKCILNYERAQKLSPKDEDIGYNLKLAGMKAVDNIQPVPQLAIITTWNDFISSKTSDGWSVVAVIFVWLSILTFAVSLFFSRRRILSVIALLLLFVSFSSLALSFHQQEEEKKYDAAIVMASSSYVKSAPDAGANDIFMVHEGTRLQLLDQVGEWTRIRLDDGKVGWMERGSFEKI